MDDNLYKAIVAHLTSTNDHDIDSYIASHYNVEATETMSTRSRVQFAMKKFIRIAKQYEWRNNNLYRVRDSKGNTLSEQLVVVPESLINEILQESQSITLGGVKKMYYHIKQQGLLISQSRIDRWLKGNTTRSVTAPRKKTQAISKPIVAYAINERWQIDAVHMKNKRFKSQRGYQYILTIVDHLTKRVWLTAMKAQNADNIRDALINAFNEEIEAGRTPPKLIQSDNDATMLAGIRKALTAMKEDGYDIKHIRAGAYNPRSNGLVERMNGIVQQKLTTLMIKDDNPHWAGYVKYVQGSINNSWQSTIKMTPLEALENEELAVIRCVENAQHMRKKYGHRTKPYDIGDRVRISLRKSPGKEALAKRTGLANWSTEIYTIVGKRGDYEYQLKDDQGRFKMNKLRIIWYTHDQLKKV